MFRLNFALCQSALSICMCLAACRSATTFGESKSIGKACEAGALRPCTCPNGSTGARTCQEDGWSFSECSCASSAGTGESHAGSGGGSGVSMSVASGGATAGSGVMSATSLAGRGGAGASGSAGAAGGPAAGSGGASGAPAPDPNVEFVTEPTDEAAYIFDQTQLRTYNIVIAAADLARIDAQPSAEIWVSAKLEFEGTTYGPLKVRYKGSAGSFKAPCTTEGNKDPKLGKCSMKIGFDEVDPEGRFYGLKKLNLHALNTDASMLRDRLGYSLFRESNIVAPRATHAKLLVNGKLEGLFIAVEQIDGRFSRARFSEGGEGNIYKELWIDMRAEADVIKSLESNTDAPNVSGMMEFQSAPSSELGRFIDTAYLMRYFAVDRVIVNDDGALHFYCDPTTPNAHGYNHNLYWYQAEKAARFWLIPWDLDLAFDNTPWVHITPAWDAAGSCTCIKPAMYDAQLPATCDALIKQALTWHADYEKEVEAFVSGAFSEARVDAKLNAWTAQIRPLVVEAAGVKNAPTEQWWMEGVARLRATIAAARANRGWKY